MENLGTIEKFDGWLFWRFELPDVSEDELTAFQSGSKCNPAAMSDPCRIGACADQRYLGNGGPTYFQCGAVTLNKGGNPENRTPRNPATPAASGCSRKIDYSEYEYGVHDEDRFKYENGVECSEDDVSDGRHVNPCAGMGNLSSQPGEKKSKGVPKDGESKSGPSKFRFGKGDSKQKAKYDKRLSAQSAEYDGASQAKRKPSTAEYVVPDANPSPGSSMSSSVYVDTHSHLPTPVEQATENDSIMEGDSQILDDGTTTLQDASPGSLSDITVFCDESSKQEVASNIVKRPPSASSTSQSLPGTPGDTHLESNFSTMGFSSMYDSRYRVHAEESSSYSSGGRDLSTSSSSSSMDLLEHFHKQRGSVDSNVPPPSTLPFTITQHRKVVLPPHKFAGPPPAGVPNGKSGISGSEECLRPANLYGNNADHQSSPSRRHSSYGDVPPLDGNVLRKVASLTLDKATIDSKVNRPKFVPEKLDFSLYEKFEGMLCLALSFLYIFFSITFEKCVQLRHVKKITGDHQHPQKG